nr:thermonuclease family protein [Geotalea sp. SG265]
MVSEVHSGDTFSLTLPSGETLKIHLYGTDAPKREKRDPKTGKVKRPGQPFGEEAFQVLKSKLERRKVSVNMMGKEKHSGTIVIDKQDIGLEMVRAGFAWAHQCNPAGRVAAEYAKAEEQARKERRGLWKQDHPQPPWEFLKLWQMKEALLVG